MTATPPPHLPIEGEFIRLEPLTREHLPRLFDAIGHPIVFASGYGGGPAGYRDTEAGFLEFAEGYYPWKTGNAYAVIIAGGPHAGDVVGTTSLTEFDLPNEEAHIGWTAYDPRVWGTAVNSEAKILLLELAFASGFHRVKIQADDLNERSKAAIFRIGATFEGVLRRHRPRADGSWRDTALFSVISDDWPTVRGILQGRLDAHSGRPVLFRTPPSSGMR
jgi:RimJ/RimL family protein N-acetyltransferase